MKNLRGYGYDLNLRGLLAWKVNEVHVELVPCKTDEVVYQVTLHLSVPDRDGEEVIDLKFVQEYTVAERDVITAGTPENAAIICALHDAWAHELREGIWLSDGTPAFNPEPDHARG